MRYDNPHRRSRAAKLAEIIAEGQSSLLPPTTLETQVAALAAEVARLRLEVKQLKDYCQSFEDDGK